MGNGLKNDLFIQPIRLLSTDIFDEYDQHHSSKSSFHAMK